MGSTKSNLNDFAIFGGRPAFTERVHVGRPNLGNRQRLLERFNALLDARWFSNHGPLVQEFEERIAEAVGAEHCIATCNATIALELVTRALELSGEVIVPSFTFIATAHALRWLGLTPVFCDVTLRDCTIDAGYAERLITPRSTAILGVHLWGRPCAVDRLSELALKHNLKLIFDAAHAFGCSANGRMIGNFGTAEVFSFHATKIINSFEGGAIITNNSELAAKVRLMRNFGFAGYDNVIQLGINGKMSEPSAAMGLTSLESLEDFVAANRRNYEQYQRELNGLKGVELLPYDETERCNYQYITLRINEEPTRISRNDLCKILCAENVLARRYFHPGCHKVQPYCSDPAFVREPLPNTETLAASVLSLPTGPTLDASDIGTLCEIIRCVVQNGPEFRQRLSVQV
jgi:dTDP-4-amino-4,6-dideoxygalactose transaminase